MVQSKARIAPEKLLSKHRQASEQQNFNRKWVAQEGKPNADVTDEQQLGLFPLCHCPHCLTFLLGRLLLRTHLHA